MRPFDPALLPHLRPARRPLAVVVAAGVVGGLVTLALAFALGSLVVGLVEAPTGDGWHRPAGWAALLLAARAATAYVGDVAAARAATTVSTTLRRRMLATTVQRDASSLSRERTGELTLLSTKGLAATEPYLTRYVPALVLATVLPLLTLAAIAWLDWLSAVIVACTLPLVPGFAVLIGLVTRDRADRQWRELGALSGHFLDVVRGLPTLLAHGRARAQARTIATVSERHRRATTETLRVAFLSSAVLELIATISVALVAVAVGLRLAAGSMEFSTALVVLLLAPEAYWPLRRVGAEFHAAAEGTAAFARVDELLGSPVEVTGSRPVPTGAAISLTGLSYTYPGRETPALGAVSDVVPATGLTAITGPSGCGKSTLLALLLGELSPTSGTLRVGDLDLADLEPAAWRGTVAWAPQRPWLTSGTIADNVRTGRPRATDAEVWEALERVDLAATVAALPDGLETPLGQDGAGLSAGQRARLALARVILADRPWVLLDEPSAHLDLATERILLDTLRELARDRAVAVVAHRPAVVDAADHVLRLPGPAPGRLAGPTPVVARALPVVDTTPVTAPAPRWGRRTAMLLGSLSVASGVALTATASWLIARAAEQPPVLMLMVAIVGVRLFGLARPVLRYAERLLSHDAVLALLARRRVAVYESLVPLTPGALGPRRGDLLASVVEDVDAMTDRELRVRQPWLTALLVGTGSVLYAGWLAAPAGWVAAALLLAGVAAGLLGRAGAAASEPAAVRSRARLAGLVAEMLDGARDLVLWQAEGAALADVDAESERLTRSVLHTARTSAAARGVVLLATAAGLGATALWVPGSVTGPTLALLLLLPVALADVYLPLPEAGALEVRTRAAEDRLESLAGRSPVTTDPADPAPLPTQDRPTLAAHDLSAGWGEVPAFSGVDLVLTPGARVGVVGPSGSGKSTLAGVLMRFLEPSAGRVELAGVDTATLLADDVRTRVGLVDDDPYVFASTVLENVRLARPEASDEEVALALSRARLGEWVSALPEGTATMVGEGHARVSGGERARIGIARALLADTPVLVLDEPTAHLDTDTAQRVASEVMSEQQDRSVLWITHGTVGLDDVDSVLALAGEPQGPDRRAGGHLHRVGAHP